RVGVALTGRVAALAVPLWVRAPPRAVRVRLPFPVVNWASAAPVLALRVRLPPAVVSVLAVLAKVRAPPWAVKVALRPAAVCKLRTPACDDRSLKVIDVWAVTLMLFVEATAA